MRKNTDYNSRNAHDARRNTNMNHVADIVEIFSSLQGEGPYTGTAMTFVRFEQCDLLCQWCDTSYAFKHHNTCRVESPSIKETFIEVPNPLTVTKLNNLLEPYNNEYISVTGGEPLLHAAFLSEWLPSQSFKKRILLETNGVHADELSKIIDQVHIISMDLKLPSSTGFKPLWNEHAQFLKTVLINHKEIYIKIIVTERTTDRDLQMAICLISQMNKYLPIIIQPASPTLTFHETISDDRLSSFSRIFSAYLPNVSVMPQMHKQMGIL